MTKKISFAVFYAGILMYSPVPVSAQAVNCATTPDMPTCACTQLGATKMSNDRSNIIACMLTTPNTDPKVTNCTLGGGCKWKSTTSGSAVGKCYDVGATTTPNILYPLSGFDGSETVTDIVAGYWGQSNVNAAFPQIISSVVYSVTNHNDMNLIGLQCKQGYVRTACGGSSSLTDVYQISPIIANNGCTLGNVYLRNFVITCCQKG